MKEGDGLKVYTDKIEEIKDQIRALEVRREEIDKDNDITIQQRLNDIEVLKDRVLGKEEKLSALISENKSSKEEYDRKSEEVKKTVKDTNAYLEVKSKAYHESDRRLGEDKKALVIARDDLAKEKTHLEKLTKEMTEKQKQIGKDFTELEKSKSQIKFSEGELEKRDKNLAEREIEFTATEIDLSMREKNLVEAIKAHGNSIKMINEARVVVNKGLEKNDIQEKKIVEREEAVKKSIKKNQDKENSLEVLERSLAIKGRENRERLTLAQNLEKKLW
ncbi:hypothetical protein IID24_04730 [Patescibacteria group bacterium]|nr:hypothetical protein [Patescibacteria group bacterium]